MVRLARKEDSQKLLDFLVFNNGERVEKLATDYIQSCFSDDYRKPHFVVFESDDEIIGAAAFSEELFTVGTWGISWVSVHPEHRKQGYGEELVRFCLLQIAKRIENECFVILGTYPNKTGLYDKIGFFEVHSDEDHGSFMMTKVKPEKKV